MDVYNNTFITDQLDFMAATATDREVARCGLARGNGLTKAIARVNRVFQDKPGGLVVGYLGLAHELKHALATYTQSGGTGRTTLCQSEAVAVMLEKCEVCRGLFHGFDYSG